jgi:very-short-patch-repair endonuclease
MPSRPHPMVPSARDLRKRQTSAEVAMWRLLRDRRLDGVKFRRQHPIGPFVVDFCCPASRLVIELDGMIHDELVEQDEERTRQLEASGYRVVRFRNEEVTYRRNEVLDQIVELTHPRMVRHER